MMAERVPEPSPAEAWLRSHLYQRSELHRIPKPEPLVGPLHRSTYAIASGRDGSFKSFYALDLALHVATGTAYVGKPVEKGHVLYLAAEGAPGFDDRISAWEQEWGVEVEGACLEILWEGFSFYGDDPNDKFEAVLDYVKEQGTRLIVIDTLRRISGGADENGSSMGVIIDRIIKLREAAPGCTVLVVAHTGKSDQDTRGFSGIEDDADTVLRVVRPDPSGRRLRVTHAKSKYGEPQATRDFELKRMGSSLVVVPSEPAQPRLSLPPGQRRVLHALSHGSPCTAKEIESLTDLRSSSYRSALEQLVDKGYAIRAGTPGHYTWQLSDTLTDAQREQVLSSEEL